MSYLDEVPVFCVMCGKEVPLERKRKRSVTCGEACTKARTSYLRERKELRKCKYCNQPSTLAEREEFRLWRRERRAKARAAAKAAKAAKAACPHEHVRESHWSGVQDNHCPAGGTTFTCTDCGVWWTDDDKDPREQSVNQ